MNKQRHQDGRLRIIGGNWRSRTLNFPAIEGLRPTADRVRETLFNWLQMQIPGAHCLDLFAGSGALGLEALSRGAAEVVMVEQNSVAASRIRQHLQTLDCSTGKVETRDVFEYLAGQSQIFDVVFLDPPYRLACLAECCRLLEENGWLREQAFIYLEDDYKQPPPQLPENWQYLRNKQAGQTRYYLAQRRT